MAEEHSSGSCGSGRLPQGPARPRSCALQLSPPPSRPCRYEAAVSEGAATSKAAAKTYLCDSAQIGQCNDAEVCGCALQARVLTRHGVV